MRLVRVLLLLAGLALLLWCGSLLLEGVINFGVVVPALIGLSGAALALGWNRLGRWRARAAWRQRLWALVGGAAGVWLCSFVAFLYTQTGPLPALDAGADTPVALIVLGAGARHCQASRTLQIRLDAAYAAALRWPQMPLLVSGGPHGSERRCTEAEVMRRELLRRGLPPERIWVEDRSRSTADNFAFSRAVLERAGLSLAQPIAFATSDIHGPRAARIARKAGYQRLVFVRAETPLRYRYNGWFREYFAALSSWLLGET